MSKKDSEENKNDMLVNNELDDKDLTPEELEKMQFHGKWTSHDTIILKEWAEHANSFTILHDKSTRYYKMIDLFTSIPVIAIGVATGSASFANIDPFYSMILGISILLSGLVTTIVKYMEIAKLREQHLRQSKDWSKFYRNIKLELQKPPRERSHKKTFMDMMKKDYDKLYEEMPLIPSKFLKRYKKKLGVNDIALPLTIADIKGLDTYQQTSTDIITEIPLSNIDEIRNKFIEEYHREPSQEELNDLLKLG